MTDMARTSSTSVRIPPELRQAAEAWMKKNGETSLGRVMLVALCHHIGKPKLAEKLRLQGRPPDKPNAE